MLSVSLFCLYSLFELQSNFPMPFLITSYTALILNKGAAWEPLSSYTSVIGLLSTSISCMLDSHVDHVVMQASQNSLTGAGETTEYLFSASIHDIV